MVKNTKIISDLNSIAIPLILSAVSGVIMGIIDQALVGRISIDAYAGVGLVTTSINSIIGILGAMSIAFNIMGSRCRGDNNIDELNNKFTVYIIISILTGIGLFIFINIFSTSILNKGFGLEAQVLIEANNFIRIYSLSILLNLLIFTYSTVFKIFRKTQHILFTTILVNIVNVILDYCLIFGRLGFPEMGAKGAAIGTVIALTMHLIIYVIIARKLVKISFCVDSLFFRMKETIKFSIPFMGQEFMEDILFVIGMNAIVARIGVLELSTYTLILQIINLVLMPMFGYTTANLSLISENSIKNDKKEVMNISKYTSIILITLHLIIFTFILVFKNQIPYIITSDEMLINSATTYLPIAIFIQLFNYLMNIYKSSMQAINYQKWTLKLAFMTNTITLVLIGVSSVNLYGIYIIIGLSYLFNFIVFYLKYKKVLSTQEGVAIG